ncbi:MAG: hypothetical protein FWC50_07845 [Planctomycetaceae bacterium]|nr:hypothetical protein [Planctomycetaceae bacterium]
MSDKLRRQLLGIITLILFGIVLVIHATGHFERWEGVRDACIRSAVFTGLAWLAWDDLVKIPKWFAVVGFIIFAGVIIRPKLIPYMLLILIPAWLLLKFLRLLAAPLPPPRSKK